jgi:hypothetical protein
MICYLLVIVGEYRYARAMARATVTPGKSNNCARITLMLAGTLAGTFIAAMISSRMNNREHGSLYA